MGSSKDRYFRNPYQEQSESNLFEINDDNVAVLHPDLAQKLRETTMNLQKLLYEKAGNNSGDNFTVYSGLSGLFYVFAVLRKRGQGLFSRSDLEKRLVSPCLKHLDSLQKRISFLQGQAGPLVIALFFYSHENDNANKNRFLTKLLKIKESSEYRNSPDELLYGKAGYLYALLIVKRELNIDACDKVIQEVINDLIRSGKAYSKRTHSASPLMYEWHDKEYLGAAHGLGGILMILLHAQQFLSSDQLNLVRSSLDYLLNLTFASTGNFPSSISGMKDGRDKLVQWCHGSPGMIPLFCKAYETFKDQRYLDICIKSSDDVWKRGLLKKGFGLCHGTAGNGYCFLDLYRVTQDRLHLQRALKFAEWCMNYTNPDCFTPDRPYSLFEGLAGCLHFLSDIEFNLKSAEFPCYVNLNI